MSGVRQGLQLSGQLGLPQVSVSQSQQCSLTKHIARRWHKPKDNGSQPQQVKFNNNNNSFSNKNSYEEEEECEDIDVGEENLDVSFPERREDSLGRQRSRSSGIYETFPWRCGDQLVVIFRPSVHLLHRPPVEHHQQHHHQSHLLWSAVRGK